ncbi:MAG: VOC family protein [Aridibacter sp.]
MNLNQVTVYSKDVKKAVQFYQKLGLLFIFTGKNRKNPPWRVK